MLLKRLLLVFLISIAIMQPVKADGWDTLASAKTVFIMGSVVAFVSATLNIVWAIDWTRFGVSDETSTRIQEGSGIAGTAFGYLFQQLGAVAVYMVAIREKRTEIAKPAELVQGKTAIWIDPDL